MARVRWWMTLTIAVCVGLFVALVIVSRWNPEIGLLTDEQFTAAQQRWKSRGPRDYDLQVAVSGRQSAVYEIQVREGQVVTALRDSRPLPDRRTWDTWSVPGMFETMRLDLELVARVAAGTAPAGAPNLVVQGEFDEEFGYPRKYIRTDQTGAKLMVTWEVRRFSQ